MFSLKEASVPEQRRGWRRESLASWTSEILFMETSSSGVFSSCLEFLEHSVLLSQGLLIACAQTVMCILSHLVYFKFLKGRRNYGLFTLKNIYCIVEPNALVNE